MRLTRPAHRITKEIARQQYNAAKARGWLPFVIEAAQRFGETPENVLAIGSRETNLSARFLKESGDRGNGYGLMQSDRRYHRAWVQSGKWRDARECFLKGAEVLRSNRLWLLSHAGKVVTVQDSRGNTRNFTLPHYPEPLLTRIAIAMYNGGPWAASNPAHKKPIDVSTTNRDYSEDVLERAEWFAELLEADGLIALGYSHQSIPEQETQQLAAIPLRSESLSSQETLPNNVITPAQEHSQTALSPAELTPQVPAAALAAQSDYVPIAQADLAIPMQASTRLDFMGMIKAQIGNAWPAAIAFVQDNKEVLKICLYVAVAMAVAYFAVEQIKELIRMWSATRTDRQTVK